MMLNQIVLDNCKIVLKPRLRRCYMHFILVFLQLEQKYSLEYQTSLFLGVCLTVFKVNFWLQFGHNSLLLKIALCFTIVELVFTYP